MYTHLGLPHHQLKVSKKVNMNINLNLKCNRVKWR